MPFLSDLGKILLKKYLNAKYCLKNLFKIEILNTFQNLYFKYVPATSHMLQRKVKSCLDDHAAVTVQEQC